MKGFALEGLAFYGFDMNAYDFASCLDRIQLAVLSFIVDSRLNNKSDCWD